MAWRDKCPVPILLNYMDASALAQHGAIIVPRAHSLRSPVSGSWYPDLFRLLLSGLLGLSSSGLPSRSLLLGLLGAADGANTGDSILTKVSTVTVLGGQVGDTLVDPVQKTVSQSVKSNITYFNPRPS